MWGERTLAPHHSFWVALIHFRKHPNEGRKSRRWKKYLCEETCQRLSGHLTLYRICVWLKVSYTARRQSRCCTSPPGMPAITYPENPGLEDRLSTQASGATRADPEALDQPAD